MGYTNNEYGIYVANNPQNIIGSNMTDLCIKSSAMSPSPTTEPSLFPSSNPSLFPTFYPTSNASFSPTMSPSSNPTFYPTNNPFIPLVGMVGDTMTSTTKNMDLEDGTLTDKNVSLSTDMMLIYALCVFVVLLLCFTCFLMYRLQKKKRREISKQTSADDELRRIKSLSESKQNEMEFTTMGIETDENVITPDMTQRDESHSDDEQVLSDLYFPGATSKGIMQYDHSVEHTAEDDGLYKPAGDGNVLDTPQQTTIGLTPKTTPIDK